MHRMLRSGPLDHDTARATFLGRRNAVLTELGKKTEINCLLPATFIPLQYNIHIVCHPHCGSFNGICDVEFALECPSETITLHGMALSDIVTEPPSDVKRLDDDSFTMVFEKPFSAQGTHHLIIHYTGRLNEDELEGAFALTAESRDGSFHQKLIATHFEPVGCRQVVPCLDEPYAKAQMYLTVTAPSECVVISCMPIESVKPFDPSCGLPLVVVPAAGDDVDEAVAPARVCEWKSTTFLPTPPMSTYLFAFCVGHFEPFPVSTRCGTPVNIVTPRGRGGPEHCTFGAGIAANAVDCFFEYFCSGPEVEKVVGDCFPLPKIDLVALPDFAISAMENWGCPFFLERCLLANESTASGRGVQRVAESICHEISHVWFGCLVTPIWWDSVWMKEGFAQWFGYWAMAKVLPTNWHPWETFTVSELGAALNADQFHRCAHPLQQQVSNPRDIEDVFDDLAYNKGAAVAHMLHSFLGGENLRRGFQVYVQRHCYSNASCDDLWRSLEDATDVPVRIIMEQWICAPGYPYLSVEVIHPSDLYARFLTDTGALEPDSPDHDSPSLPRPSTSCIASRKGSTVNIFSHSGAPLHHPHNICNSAASLPTGAGKSRIVLEVTDGLEFPMSPGCEGSVARLENIQRRMSSYATPPAHSQSQSTFLTSKLFTAPSPAASPRSSNISINLRAPACPMTGTTNRSSRTSVEHPHEAPDSAESQASWQENLAAEGATPLCLDVRSMSAVAGASVTVPKCIRTRSQEKLSELTAAVPDQTVTSICSEDAQEAKASEEPLDNVVICLTQRRFIAGLPEHDFASEWVIPVVFGTTDEREYRHVFGQVAEHVMLPWDAHDIPFVNANVNASSLYRVHYSPPLFRALVAAINDDHSDISSLDRMGLLRDALAMCLLRTISVADILDLLVALRHETSSIALQIIVEVINELCVIFDNSSVIEQLQRRFVDILAEPVRYLGIVDGPYEDMDRSMVRPLVHTCHFVLGSKEAESKLVELYRFHIGEDGDDVAVESSKPRSGSFLNDMTTTSMATSSTMLNPTATALQMQEETFSGKNSHDQVPRKSVSANMRSAVLRVGIENGGDAEWERQYAKFLEMPSGEEKQQLLWALGIATKNEEFARRLMNYCVETLRRNEGPRGVAAVGNNPRIFRAGWKWFSENIDAAIARWGKGWAFAAIMKHLTSRFSLEEDAAEIVAFFEPKNVNCECIEQCAETIRSRAAVRHREVAHVTKWLELTAARANSMSFSVTSFTAEETQNATRFYPGDSDDDVEEGVKNEQNECCAVEPEVTPFPASRRKAAISALGLPDSGSFESP